MDVTFKIKDVNSRVLGASALVDAFIKADFEAWALVNFVATNENTLELATTQVFEYNGTNGTDGSVQTVTLQPGTYFIECWGAEGAQGRQGTTLRALGGKGGYVSGTITLAEETTVYVSVGGKNVINHNVNRRIAGWNGGGHGTSIFERTAGGGGGASDIRIGGTALTDRVLVAGGGGGGRSDATTSPGADGGGLEGDSASPGGVGGTQEAGGNFEGIFGRGGRAAVANSNSMGGGGGGWFGGGGGPSGYNSGGGGSSYIGDELEISGVSYPKVPVEDGYTESGVRTGHGQANITALPAVGYSVSLSADVTASSRNLEVIWKEHKPLLTNVFVDTAIIDNTETPAELDWVMQTSRRFLTDVPLSLLDKDLYARIRMDTEDTLLAPHVEWFIIQDKDVGAYAAVRVEFEGEIKTVDPTGEVVFLGLAAGTFPYKVYTLGLREYSYRYLTEGSVTVGAVDIEENVGVIVAHTRVTNIALQADVFEGPILARLTNIGIQVELGEYYSVALPLRTRPVPAAARVFPKYANARVTGVP